VSSAVFTSLVKYGFRYKLDPNLPMIKELIIECFLRFNCSSDVIRVKLNPDTAFSTRLFHINLLHFSKISAYKLDLVLDINIKARFLLQVNFLRVKHVSKHNAIRWMSLCQSNGLNLLRRFDFPRVGNPKTHVFISHKFLHQLCSCWGRFDVNIIEVFIALVLIVSCDRRTISQYVHSQDLSTAHLEAIHRLTGKLCFFMWCKLDDCVAFILPERIFRNFDPYDFAERLEEFTNFWLTQTSKCSG
jgi:hypothetical protein